ncbi:MAG: hypothetical protein QM811_25670 [Pirellulales bacterium]
MILRRHVRAADAQADPDDHPKHPSHDDVPEVSDPNAAGILGTTRRHVKIKHDSGTRLSAAVMSLQNFGITEIEFHCNECRHGFVWRRSADDAFIKFVDASGKLERWLPIYGVGGYLDLLERIVPDFRQNQEITMQISRVFQSNFKHYQHPPATGGYWTFGDGPRCPGCGSRDIRNGPQRIIDDSEIEMLTYDPIP